MPNISQIRVFIHTAEDDGSGTDSDVYLGIGGREFFLDTTRDDFETFQKDHLIINGQGGSAPLLNVGSANDPKRPPLHTDFLDKFPVYIRMEPRGDRPSWTVLFYRDPSGPAFMQDLTSILVLVDVAEVVGGQVMNRKFREYVPFITDAELKSFDPASTRQDHGVHNFQMGREWGKICYLRRFPA